MSYHRHEHLSGRSRRAAYRRGLLRGIENRFARIAVFSNKGIGMGRNKPHPDQARIRREIFEMINRL